MFHLFDFFMDALKNGMVLFVDELDAKLHPLLTRYIINLFHNSQTNIGNGQLIYSTHDTVNLTKKHLEEMRYGLQKKIKTEFQKYMHYLIIYSISLKSL